MGVEQDNLDLRHQLKKLSHSLTEATRAKDLLGRDFGAMKREFTEYRESLQIEKKAYRDNAANDAATVRQLLAENGVLKTQRDRLHATAALDGDRLQKKNDQLAKRVEVAERNMNAYGKEDQLMNGIDESPSPPAPTGLVPVPKPAPGGIGEMLTNAVQLAAVQQSSRLAVEKVSPLLIKAGLPAEFVNDTRIQGILCLVLPYLVSTYGHMVPGLKKMESIQSLSQQQLVIGLADIIGLSVRDLLGVGFDIVKSLNEGASMTVEQVQNDHTS